MSVFWLILAFGLFGWRFGIVLLLDLGNLEELGSELVDDGIGSDYLLHLGHRAVAGDIFYLERGVLIGSSHGCDDESDTVFQRR